MSPVCDKPQASFRLFVSVLCLPWALLCHLLAVWQTTILCSLPSLGFSLPFFSCLANNIHLLELSFLFFCFPCPWFFFAFLCISARQRSFSSSRIRLFNFLFRLFFHILGNLFPRKQILFPRNQIHLRLLLLLYVQ